MNQVTQVELVKSLFEIGMLGKQIEFEHIYLNSLNFQTKVEHYTISLDKLLMLKKSSYFDSAHDHID